MCRTDEALEGHGLLGLLFSLASTVLLILITFSAPFIGSIHFLSASGTRYGAFGFCSTALGCIKPVLGYSSRGEIEEWRTRTFIMFGLALFMLISLLALILSILRLGTIMRNPVFFRSTALIGCLLSLLPTIFALSTFIPARSRFNISTPGSATYGAALWMGVAATISAFLATAIGGPPITAKYLYRADRQVAYNV